MNKKGIKYEKTEKLIEILKPFWKEMRDEQSKFFMNLKAIELKMAKKTKIKDIEFFWCDDGIVGIGNTDRTMELIHDGELEGE